MENNKKIKLDLLQYLLGYYMYGWLQYLNANEIVFLNIDLQYLSTLLQGKEVELIEGKYFYKDLAVSKNFKDYGMSNKTFGKVLQSLHTKGLIVYDQGQKGAGISRIYYPLVIPKPPTIKLPKFFEDRFKNEVNFVAINDKKREEIVNGKERIDYTKMSLSDFRLNPTKDIEDQTKRVKIQNQYLILLNQHGVDISDKNFENKQRGKATNFIGYCKNPFMAEVAIEEVFFYKKIKLTEVEISTGRKLEDKIYTYVSGILKKKTGFKSKKEVLDTKKAIERNLNSGKELNDKIQLENKVKINNLLNKTNIEVESYVKTRKDIVDDLF